MKKQIKGKGVIIDKLDGLNLLISRARQMQLEQQYKIESCPEYYNEHEKGVLIGVNRIVNLLNRSKLW